MWKWHQIQPFCFALIHSWMIWSQDHWEDFWEVGWWCVFRRYRWCWKWSWIFWEAIDELKELISKRESRESGVCIGFFDWFSQYKVENIINGMLKPVWREAGNPPSQFTTNASESVNAIIKRKVDYRKSELHVFINNCLMSKKMKLSEL